MWPSVRSAFVPFTVKIEGFCTWMYLDVKCLVTTGDGNLIDPIETAVGLPFIHPDTGGPATQDEIRTAWAVVKSRRDMAPRGGGAFAALTSIRLTPDGVDQLVATRLDANESYLRGRFPEWDAWPADAQLGTLSMAWAMGPAFAFPRFEQAAHAQEWGACALQCHIDTAGNPGVVKRNTANVALFKSAAAGVAGGRDASELPTTDDVA